MFILFIGFLCFNTVLPANAQVDQFRIQSISLPAELRDFNNQFSCLNIVRGKLYLLAESRILENQEAKIYSVELHDLDKYLLDSTYKLPFKKHRIIGLDILVSKMLQQQQVCEGLEAMVVKGKKVFLSVETTTSSPFCYILRGNIKKDNIYLDTTMMLPVIKPVKPNGSSIYNASYEAMERRGNKLLLFFEYNYFEHRNDVYSYKTNLDALSKDSIPVNRIPYRVSDIKKVGRKHYTAINSFYKGGGNDTINRPSIADTINFKLVHNGLAFHDYARLIDIRIKRKKFAWKPLFEIPAVYEGFNWEGISRYKKGYFIVNDVYTPAKPYYSTLFYLHPVK